MKNTFEIINNEYVIGKTSKGKEFKFDLIYLPLLEKYTWTTSEKGYIVTFLKGQIIRMHRAILMLEKSVQVDHINGDKTDNRKSNLRKASNSQNMMNSKKRIYKNTTSIYKGVSLYGKKKYQAQITLNQKVYDLGRFENEIEAAKAYNKKAKELFGEFAYLNVIKKVRK